jgi:uncharacterized protein YaaN involved in tellurite resistance
MANVAETVEERVKLIDENLESLKRKMKDLNGRKKYGYHFRMLKKARKKVFETAQKPNGYHVIK